MNTTITRCLVVAALLAMTTTAIARSWRINSNAAKKAHFVDINAACASDDVTDGDTLYLDPGCLLSATQNVTKRLTIIGTGYFTNALIKPATISATINLKAAGIKMESAEVTGSTVLCANNIIVERCKLLRVTYSGTAQYATIRQCYIPNGQVSGAGNTAIATMHWTIENCIVIHTDGYDPILNLYYPTIRNNYIRPNYYYASASVAYINNGTIYNNICINTNFIDNANPYSVTDCVITNNIFHAKSVQSSYPDNVFIESNTEAAVFVLEGTNDQRYTLKDDSPAKGAATDGGDIGPSGGLYPYVLSGYPLGLPYFESSNTPTRAVDGQVKLSQHVKIQTK